MRPVAQNVGLSSVMADHSRRTQAMQGSKVALSTRVHVHRKPHVRLACPSAAILSIRFTTQGTDSTMRLVEAAGCCACLMVPSIPRDGIITYCTQLCGAEGSSPPHGAREADASIDPRRKALGSPCKRPQSCAMPSVRAIRRVQRCPQPARTPQTGRRACAQTRQATDPHPYRYRTTRLQRSHLGSRRCSVACRSCCMRR